MRAAATITGAQSLDWVREDGRGHRREVLMFRGSVPLRVIGRHVRSRRLD